MILKLQPDQITLFWNLIRRGVISAYGIPKEYQQDFAIKYLENLLAGNYQAWLGYDVDEGGNKKILGIMSTKIMNESEYGIRTLYITALYGYRLISDNAVKDAIDSLEKFAKSNNCDVIVAEHRSKRVATMLANNGFEKHITVSRKIIT